MAEVLEVRLEVRPGDLVIERLLDTGLRTAHRLHQYRALFQFLYDLLHCPLRQDRLTRFQSGLVHLVLYR